MARRRYISTAVSLDTKVNRLATSYGDFAALLYTWMIPHAGDDASIIGDAEEILYMVMPGRRDKTEEDIREAVTGMLSLGLLEQLDDGRLGFPPEAFYRYQTYVREDNRRKPENPPPSAPQRESAPISADQRETPKKAASLTVSPSITVKSSPSESNDSAAPADAAPDASPEIASEPFEAVEAMCDELDTDPHVLDKTALSKQCRKAKELLKRGITVDEIRDYTGYMLSQNWRDEPPDMFTVAKGIDKWRLAGKPLQARARASPRRNSTPNDELDEFMQHLG